MPQNAPFVQSVRGRIDPQALGVTLTHEHLVLDWSVALGKAPQIASRYPIGRIVERLGRAQQVGVSSLVDVTPENIAAAPLVLALAAEHVDVNIICATGLYALDVLPMPAWAYPPATADGICDRFVDAATRGIGGSGIKPGVIKVSTSAEAVNNVERTILQGAALAQKRTGLAITTHTEQTRFAMEQVDIFEAAGADLSRVVIGHVGWGSGERDYDLHQRLANRGVNLGLDLVGQPVRSDEEYARMVCDLVDGGYAEQLTLSHDQTAYCRGVAEWPAYGSEWYTGDYTAVQTRLVPLLADLGISRETIELITVGNPARILTVDPVEYPGARETLMWQPEITDALVGGDAVSEFAIASSNA